MKMHILQDSEKSNKSFFFILIYELLFAKCSFLFYLRDDKN